jgi:hypothetical protein
VESHPFFGCLDDLVSYGMKCLAFPLDEDMVEVLNKPQFKQRLRALASKLIKSMLLEFIPVEYSKCVLEIYLDGREKKESREWACNHRERFEELFPYQDLFQYMHMLSLHLVNSKKLVSLQQWLEILENPMMGVVEWPLVLGAKDMEDLPAVFEEAEY